MELLQSGLLKSSSHEDFYRSLVSEWPVTVQHIDTTRGKGVVATKDLDAHQEVFRERPAFAVQMLHNESEVLCCSHCLAFVGSLDQQLAHLLCSAGLPSPPPSIPFAETFSPPLPIFECPNGCGDRYCSIHCMETADEKYHKALCRGTDKHTHPYTQFLSHAAVAHNDYYVLASRILACVYLRYHNEDTQNLVHALEPITMFRHEPWWDTMQPEQFADDPTFRELWVNGMKQQTEESLGLLTQVLTRPGLEEVFTLDFYSRVIGMIRLNSLSIRVTSPLDRFFHRIHGESVSSDQRDHIVTVLSETVAYLTQSRLQDDCSDVLPDYQGMGMFTLQSCMNHSCEPNCEMTFYDEENIGGCVLRTIQPVSKGQELCISYMQPGQKRIDRQARLQEQYLFSCNCPLCATTLQNLES